MRPICPACNKNCVAPNYYRDGVRHWRSKCSKCLVADRNRKPTVPRWKQRGYKKKSQCDLCGFRSIYQSQIVVYHIDGNLNNCELYNLRSICLNCVETVKRKQTAWKIGDLEVDY